MDNHAHERNDMVERQLAGRGITDPTVLRAMAGVPRELFVPKDLAGEAYADGPLPIGSGQTISQPYIVALMLEALQLTGTERVLEAGAGSGYAAAVLARITPEVIAIERIPALADLARANLARAGCRNVHVECTDGTLGWPPAAPYDAILVSAGAPDIPQQLQEQLAIGGRMVIPLGRRRDRQHLVRVTRESPTNFVTSDLGPVHFVPLIGEGGWPESG